MKVLRTNPRRFGGGQVVSVEVQIVTDNAIDGMDAAREFDTPRARQLAMEAAKHDGLDGTDLRVWTGGIARKRKDGRWMIIFEVEI